MSPLVRRYLLLYNSLQALGWTVSFLSILGKFISTKSVYGTYSSAGELICFLQSLAFLEVIHGAIGIVPSGVLLPFLQWGGRTHFLLAIVRAMPEVVIDVQELPSVFITFLAWSSSEVIRYLHYAISCTASPPFWITYLRYTAFIVLYPIGVGPGEIWLMYQALPFIKEKNLYAKFFSCFSISYYAFVKVLLIVYPLLWLKLYLHLFKQRSLKLGKQKNKKN